MLSESVVDYIATDEKRQVIPWVRVAYPNGDTVVYTDEYEDIPEVVEGPDGNVRRFDCMDCHNRPSHKFSPPATAINLAMSTGRIATDLPYLRYQGVELLNASYEVKDQALAAIDKGLHEYYAEDYPEVAANRAKDIDRAVATLQQIYSENFFPEMKTDYRVRENNLSHFVNDACFRCHQESMVSDDGQPMSTDCKTCHLIVAQGPSDQIQDLEMMDLAGLEFQHPEDIDEAWKEARCTDCHDPESGY
jgi:hypothetical protein